MSHVWEEEEEQAFNNIVTEAFKIDVFSYNSKVTDEFWSVLDLIGKAKEAGDSIFNTDLAKQTGLTESHVELIQYLLCNNDHAEYGSSPRGCWLTSKGLNIYRRLKELKKLDSKGKI